MRALASSLAMKAGLLDVLRSGHYIAIDSETTGVNVGRSKIWQLSLLHIVDHKVHDVFDHIVMIDREDFDACPENVRKMIHLTWERITENGVPLRNVLLDLSGYMSDKQGVPIVGHNIHKFDLPMLHNHLMAFKATVGPNDSEAADLKLGIHPGLVLDTGMIMKAAQVEMTMLDGESCSRFYDRVGGLRRRGVKWNVSYTMEKLGIAIDDELHDAVADCLAVAKMLRTILGVS